MSASENHAAKSEAVPSTHSDHHATSHDSDSTEQISPDMDANRCSEVVKAKEWAEEHVETATSSELPLNGGSLAGAPVASGTNDDDGDISLSGSPKVRSDASATIASSHRRLDSVPPQKYSITHDVTAEISSSLASTSLHQGIQEEEEEEETDLSTMYPQDSADMDISSSSAAAHRASDKHDGDVDSLLAPTTIDKADLHFVDITLDAPDQQAGLAGGRTNAPNALAGSARTAEQIRLDSVSSQSVQSPAASAAASSAADAEQDTAVHPQAHLSAHDQSPPLSRDPGDQSDRRSVEGRYRGRPSAPSSRATSPTRSPSTSTSRRASMAPSQNPDAHVTITPSPSPSQSRDKLSTVPPPVLLAADEHGNISVVSDAPVSPRTVPAALSADDVEATTAAESEGTCEPSAQTEARVVPSDARTAASLSDEVEAVDAAEASKASESDKSDPSASSLAPPTEGKNSHPSTSPGLSDKADQVDPKARRKSSSAGAEPVESRTRMTTLPAKTKTEEIKHRADFERMMMAAKEVERKKREEEEERKRRRQDEQREALARWEREILPSWSRARKVPELEQLWWKGAPPSIRGRVWALAIGNPLMLPRNLLDQHEKKAAGSNNKPVEGTIPLRVLKQIDQDVEETLPTLKLFQPNGPLHEDLIRLCRAFVLVRMEQVAELEGAGDADRAASRHHSPSPSFRNIEAPSINVSSTSSAPEEPEDEWARRGIDIYQPGLASLAAILLINMPISTAFIALLNLLHSKPWLKALYSLLPTVLPASAAATTSRPPSLAAATRKPGSAYTLPPKDKAIRGFERVFETLLADQMPKVFANLLAHNVKLYRVVLRDWVSTLWTRWLDVDTVMRIWDVVLLDETDAMIYRVCLALVQTLESRLYVPDQEELESVLKGTNKAALAIWRRDKEMKGELISPRHSRSSISSSSASQPAAAASASQAENASGQTDVDGTATSPSQSSSAHPDPPDAITPHDYVYEQYAIQEHHVFDTLEAQQSWWKPSTLQRLLDRELSE